MSSKKQKFLDLIKNQRQKKSVEKFSGTFLDYLALIEKNPDLIKSSHKRLYDVLAEHGIEPLEDEERRRKIFGNDTVDIYSYFKDEFFE